MLIKKARLSFPFLFDPNPQNEGGKFTAMFIIDKDSPELKKIEKEIATVIEKKWEKKVPKQLEICVRDGTEKDHLPGFDEEVVFFNASSVTPPLCIDNIKREVRKSDGLFYAGCYVNIDVDLWAQDNQHGKRVNAGLVTVQFAGHGEPLGGGRRGSADDFDEVELDEEEAEDCLN